VWAPEAPDNKPETAVGWKSHVTQHNVTRLGHQLLVRRCFYNRLAVDEKHYESDAALRRSRSRATYVARSQIRAGSTTAWLIYKICHEAP